MRRGERKRVGLMSILPREEVYELGRMLREG